MAWQGIVGHDAIVERFRRGLQHDRLASTFLFVGPEGIGKKTFALKLAQSVLCSSIAEHELDPCGTCAECKQVLSDSHPDLQVVQKPPERAFIPVETFIGDREHRMRTGLCHFISLTPSGGKRRIAIIDDADWLNQEGANSLLKTLEEPSPRAIIILISTSVQRQLPTIRSRSQVVMFHPLTPEQVAACLLEQGLAEDQQQADMMAERSGGSLSKAVDLSQEAIIEFRHDLWNRLSQSSIDRAGLAKSMNQFLDAAGKEAAAKRTHFRLAMQVAIDFYHAVARSLSGLGGAEADMADSINELVQRDKMHVDTATALVERCIDAIKQINSNANLGLLVDAWVCDIAVSTRTNQGPVSVLR